MSAAPTYVAYGPLPGISFEPDVVLIVANPQQAMLMGESSNDTKLMGAPTCQAIPYAYNNHQIAMSLGCVTNRIRTGIKPTEMVVTIPKEQLGEFVGKLEKRVAANNDVAEAVSAMLNSNFPSMVVA